jgi:hypothetical protein
MDDLIDRQAAIDAIWDGTNYDIYTREVKEILEELPSAQPKKCSEVLQDMMDEDYYLFCHTGYSRLAEKDWEWLIEQVKEMEQKGRKDG